MALGVIPGILGRGQAAVMALSVIPGFLTWSCRSSYGTKCHTWLLDLGSIGEAWH